eukprot:jgi/Phyca11/115472/e_gw1.28.303.1
MTRGTFTRREFHIAFCNKIAPLLNRCPLPRSIVVLDNAKIHMYRELEELAHSTGALLFFLPLYCPQLNHIEVSFSLLKRWTINHANMAFQTNPEVVLEVALRECTRSNDSTGKKMYRKCRYSSDLARYVFDDRADRAN